MSNSTIKLPFWKRGDLVEGDFETLGTLDREAGTFAFAADKHGTASFILNGGETHFTLTKPAPVPAPKGGRPVTVSADPDPLEVIKLAPLEPEDPGSKDTARRR